MGWELGGCTRSLLQDIGIKEFKRVDIAKTYSLAMRSSEKTDWKTVNAAIIKRWSESALIYIKTMAHSGRCWEEKYSVLRNLK